MTHLYFFIIITYYHSLLDLIPLLGRKNTRYFEGLGLLGHVVLDQEAAALHRFPSTHLDQDALGGDTDRLRVIGRRLEGACDWSHFAQLLYFRKVGLDFGEIEIGKVLPHVEPDGAAQQSCNHVSLPWL